jgi:hypothetical protein
MHDVWNTLALILWIVWQVQIVFTVFMGYKTAKKTGRSVVNWIFMGVVFAVIPPPLSIILSLVSYYYYPPLMPKSGRLPADTQLPRRDG